MFLCLANDRAHVVKTDLNGLEQIGANRRRLTSIFDDECSESVTNLFNTISELLAREKDKKNRLSVFGFLNKYLTFFASSNVFVYVIKTYE